ncbi:single-stranded DNA-binding protein [bacterium]|nr:single-stranded DNA-binding protein [bacterium]
MFNLRMPDLNYVLIAGNLTRDPSFRRTTNGTSVTNFWLASNRKFKDNNGQWRDSVCYVGVVAWHKLAENCADNLRKGCAVIIEGELQSRNLRTEEGRNRNLVEIKARRVQFLNKKDELADKKADAEPTNEVKSIAIETDSNKKRQLIDFEESDESNPLKGEYDFGYQDIE